MVGFHLVTRYSFRTLVVVGVRNLNVPLPEQPTSVALTLNNGIHFVTTPECRLSRESRIEQEFEL